MKENELAEQSNAQFWEKLEECEDPQDHLTNFAEYLHKNSGSTGVYIGQLELPF